MRVPLVMIFCAAAAAALCGSTSFAQEDQPDIFREQDAREIRALACTRDSRPVEGKLYAVTSFSDAQRLNKAIGDAELQDTLDKLWHEALLRLSFNDIFAPERSKVSHNVMSKLVDDLEKKTEEETGISLSIYQIESRPMDTLTERDAPSCSFDL